MKNKGVLRYDLDACSLIAFFNQEEGAERILELFSEAEKKKIEILLHSINLCEVYYDCLRVGGKKEAERIIETVTKLPLKLICEIDLELLKTAGKFKAGGKVSLADAFVLGLAKLQGGVVVTSDRKEFEPIERNGDLEFLWIR